MERNPDKNLAGMLNDLKITNIPLSKSVSGAPAPRRHPHPSKSEAPAPAPRLPGPSPSPFIPPNDHQILSHHNLITTQTQSQIQQLESQLSLDPDNSTHKETLLVLNEKFTLLESQLNVYESIKNRIINDDSTPNLEKYKKLEREAFRFQNAEKLPAYGSSRLELESILENLQNQSRFVIIQGSTGSGKSTQIPQYLADHPKFHGKKILVTQPRKIAAISLANRVGWEWNCGGKKWSKEVGFLVSGGAGGGDSKQLKIEFLTEGKLLEKIVNPNTSSSEYFSNVGCIIIDEAHERSQTCDLLLGCFKNPGIGAGAGAAAWGNIPILVTSATIDLHEFSTFFNNAPTIRIPGRGYPVNINYLPITQSSFGSGTADEQVIAEKLIDGVVDCALKIHTNEGQNPGDILCFLTGQSDVIRAKERFEKKLKAEPNRKSLKTQVFALYGRMEPNEQSLVFEVLPNDTRKIIFATDVAETSITIDGISHVIDSGVKKGITYDPKRNITSLRLQQISKSSATQRTGRAGRTQPGQSYRLYSYQDYQSMVKHSTPEILLKPLALAVLTLRNLKIEPNEFQWISKPSPDAMRGAEKELISLGALDKDYNFQLTELGKLISQVQQEPKLVKMIYYGCTKGFGEASLRLASLFSVSNIFFWNGGVGADKATVCGKKQGFMLKEGDIVSLYRVFEKWLEKGNERSQGAWCNDNFVNGKAMKIVHTTCSELRPYFKKTKPWQDFPTGQNNQPTNDELSRIAFAGLFLNTSRIYQSGRQGRKLQYYSMESGVIGNISYNSGTSFLSNPPEWIIYDRLLQVPISLLICPNAIQESWIAEENPEFYQMCLNKSADIPVPVTRILSTEIINGLIGKFWSNMQNLEKEFDSFIEANLESSSITIYTKRKLIQQTETLLDRKIQKITEQLLNHYSEINYLGSSSTRILLGQGYKVNDILFAEDFVTVFVRNLPGWTTETGLWNYVLKNSGPGPGAVDSILDLKLLKQESITKNAIVCFKTKEFAQQFYLNSNGRGFPYPNNVPIIVKPNIPRTGGGVSKEIVGRLKLSWADALAWGKAKIWFQRPQDANSFIDNIGEFLPRGTTITGVHGETTLRRLGRNRDIAFKRNENDRAKIPPVLKIFTAFRAPGKTRASDFRFDDDEISLMPDETKEKFEYAVTVSNLPPRMDEFEIKNLLRHNRVVGVRAYRYGREDKEERIDPETGKFSDQLLEYLRQVLHDSKGYPKYSSKTNFYDKSSLRRGIYLGFNRITTLREAYRKIITLLNHEWSMLTPPYGQPIRLETEYTLTLSIQAEIYNLLENEIQKVVSEAKKVLGVRVTKTEPKNQNSGQNQFIFLRFHDEETNHFSAIQQQIDSIITYTKYRAEDKALLFGWTGQMLMDGFKYKKFLFTSNYSQEIWIYGSDETFRLNVEMELDKIIQGLKSLSYLDYEFKLNKKLILGKRGGISNVEKMVKSTRKLFSKFLGYRLIISATKADGDELKQKLEKENLIFTSVLQNETCISAHAKKHLKECGLCYCLPEDNKYVVFTNCKPTCGKTFCLECIVPMFQQQPPPFPLKCPTCENLLIIDDILKWGPAEDLRKILEVSLESYKKENKARVISCPKPGCEQLLNLRTVKKPSHGSSGEFIYCDECQISYCLICSAKMDKPIPIHEDEFCDEIQSGNQNRLRIFIRQITENILNLKCPQCQTVFLDFDGCAALSCNTCKTGFCGLCLENCGSDELTHSHVAYCKLNQSGNFFVNAQTLDSAHKNIRLNKLRLYFQKLENPEDKDKILSVICKDLISLGIGLNEL